MASPESITAPLSAIDVSALSDAELADFMKNNRRPGRGYELPVHGWDKLSKDQRNELAERLKAQQRALAQSPAACSRPLDLAELDARLRNVSDGHQDSSRARRRTTERSRTRSPLIDDEALARLRETEAYHDLVDDAGRPLYPIDLLDHVLGSPDLYDEMLRPWNYDFRYSHSEAPLKREHVFGRQWRRWTDFRRWQRDNRGIWDESLEGFPAYVERVKHFMRPFYTTDQYAEMEAEIKADPSTLPWDFVQWEREEQRYYCREHGCNGFSDYVEAVKRRLAQNDFTPTFQLKEDPKQQDQLTTWIECLNFEYWWRDRCTRTIERLKADYDKAWQELVDSKVLRPRETEESIRTAVSAWNREAEKDRAQDAVQRAKAAAMEVYKSTQQDPNRLGIPRAKRISMMEAATTRLNAAKAHLEMLNNRSNRIIDFIQGTFDFTDAKLDAARHRILLQWVLDQVPLVEAEMAQFGPCVIKGEKRRFTTEEDHTGKRRSKRKKLELQKSGSTTAPVATEESSTERHLGIAQPEAQGSQTKTSLTGRAPQPVDAPKDLVAAHVLRRARRALAPQTGRPGLRPRPSATPKEPPRPEKKTRATMAKGGTWKK